MLNERGPQRAGEIVAAGGDRDRDAAPAHEPVRDVAHQRPERRRAAEAEEGVGGRELPDVCREPGQHVAAAEHERAAGGRGGDAAAVGEPAHHHAPEAEADHGERERQRCFAARDAEARLHRRQRHHERPHADAADRANDERDREPQPGVGRLDSRARAHARSLGTYTHFWIVPDENHALVAPRGRVRPARVRGSALPGRHVSYLSGPGGRLVAMLIHGKKVLPGLPEAGWNLEPARSFSTWVGRESYAMWPRLLRQFSGDLSCCHKGGLCKTSLRIRRWQKGRGTAPFLKEAAKSVR